MTCRDFLRSLLAGAIGFFTGSSTRDSSAASAKSIQECIDFLKRPQIPVVNLWPAEWGWDRASTGGDWQVEMILDVGMDPPAVIFMSTPPCRTK